MPLCIVMAPSLPYHKFSVLDHAPHSPSGPVQLPASITFAEGSAVHICTPHAQPTHIHIRGAFGLPTPAMGHYDPEYLDNMQVRGRGHRDDDAEPPASRWRPHRPISDPTPPPTRRQRGAPRGMPCAPTVVRGPGAST